MELPIQFNMLVLIRIRETNRSQIPRVGEEKTQASSHLRPHLGFTGGSWWLFPLILTLESPVCSAVPETALLTAIPAFTSH